MLVELMTPLAVDRFFSLAVRLLVAIFRSARTSCRTFDVSRPVPSATIFPEFIDEL